MKTNDIEQYRKLVFQLRDQYKVVLEKVDAIFARQEPTANTETLRVIQNLLVDVKHTESKLEPLRAQLQASGNTTPVDVREVVDQTVGMVSKLIPRMGQLEQAAVESRERMAPEIHASVRAVQMQSAYSRRA